MPKNNMNNAKVLSSTTLKKFKSKYVVTFDKANDVIVVGIADSARTTSHNANESFHINSKKFHRKICFGLDSIRLWKELQEDDSTKDVTIFDVHNAIVMLKAMYQRPDKNKIVEIARNGFDGVKRPISF